MSRIPTNVQLELNAGLQLPSRICDADIPERGHQSPMNSLLPHVHPIPLGQCDAKWKGLQESPSAAFLHVEPVADSRPDWCQVPSES